MDPRRIPQNSAQHTKQLDQRLDGLAKGLGLHAVRGGHVHKGSLHELEEGLVSCWAAAHLGDDENWSVTVKMPGLWAWEWGRRSRCIVCIAHETPIPRVKIKSSAQVHPDELVNAGLELIVSLDQAIEILRNYLGVRVGVPSAGPNVLLDLRIHALN
jgi:hypothetical protein